MTSEEKKEQGPLTLHVIDGGTESGSAGFYRVKHVRKDRDFYQKPCPEHLLCQWCAHQIHPRVPVGLPIRYKERKEVFRVERQFCSWNCCLAFSHDMNDYHKYERSMWIRLLAKRMHGYKLAAQMNMAPRREVLSIFGGTVTDIEEFRKGSNEAIVLERPPLCTVIPEEQTILTRLQHPVHVPPPSPRAQKPSTPPPSSSSSSSSSSRRKKKNNASNYTLKNTSSRARIRARNEMTKSRSSQNASGKIGAKNHYHPNSRKRGGGVLQDLGITIR